MLLRSLKSLPKNRMLESSVEEKGWEEFPQVIKIEYLREEAINWIKEWKNDSDEAYRTQHFPQAMRSDAKIEAFKDFFNITEEDLK